MERLQQIVEDFDRIPIFGLLPATRNTLTIKIRPNINFLTAKPALRTTIFKGNFAFSDFKSVKPSKPQLRPTFKPPPRFLKQHFNLKIVRRIRKRPTMRTCLQLTLPLRNRQHDFTLPNSKRIITTSRCKH